MSTSIPVGDLLQCVVECGQKAARIAQIFRDQDDLFGLLVEEKSLLERNDKMVQDYKTLADVLVQETIRRDVGQRFPSLLSNIKGEEQNSFKNSLGQSIHVELTASEEDTASLLSKVLDGRDHFAKSLASVVHATAATCKRQFSSKTSIPADSIGIWIDPIDSTAEYIQGKSDNPVTEHGFQPFGLKCVCVLIGIYELESGKPIVGVVNQPFFQKATSDPSWECRFYWAVNYNSDRFTSPSLRPETPQPEDKAEKTIVISASESKQLQSILSTKYKLVHTAGAGYKALLVACQKADLWVLSQATSYFWDTCGPHSLLGAQGGGMVRFDEIKDVLDSSDLMKTQLVYSSSGGGDDVNEFKNSGGVVAYTKTEDVMELVQLLRDSGYLSNK